MNDIADREFDARVARTKSRPLASGEVSVKQALLLLVALLTLSLCIALLLPRVVLALAAGSLVLVVSLSLHEAYHLVAAGLLGLTFNWGALMAGLPCRKRSAARACALCRRSLLDAWL